MTRIRSDPILIKSDQITKILSDRIWLQIRTQSELIKIMLDLIGSIRIRSDAHPT